MKLDNVIAERTRKTIYRDGKKIIKQFDEHYNPSAIFNEALNQAKAKEMGLNVPEIYSVEKISGKWAIISEFIEGNTMSHEIRDYPETTEKYINMLADIQINIESHEDRNLNHMRHKLDRKICDSEFDATVRYYLHLKLGEMLEGTSVCHGDLIPSNIILRDDVPYIIDWSHVTQGDRKAEVARSYLLFGLQGKKELGEQYISVYCSKTGTKKEEIAEWMPIIAASQYIKRNDEEKKFLFDFVTRG